MHTLSAMLSSSRCCLPRSVWSLWLVLLVTTTTLSSLIRLRVGVAAFATTTRLPVIATVWGSHNAKQHRISRRAPLNMASTSSSITTTKTVAPPVARREKDRVVYAGVAKDKDAPMPRQAESSTEALLDPPVPIADPYGWLRDEARTNEEVLDHLRKENEYTESHVEHLAPLRETLYKEMKSSIQETDYTVPRPRDGAWWYYTRTYEGKSYQVYCRAPKTTDALPQKEWDGTAESPILADEQVYLDVNALAAGQKYCSPGRVKTSPSHKLLAYTVDFSGDETCQLYVKDLETNEIVNHDPDLEVYGQIVWGKDDSALYYLKMDAAHRPYQVYRRDLSDKETEDKLLFEEPDDLYWTYMYKSMDEKYLFVETSSKETSEIHFLDLTDPNAKLQCISKRRSKVLYEVDHRHGQWIISSNVGGTPNMQFLTCEAKPNCQDDWKKVTFEDDALFDGGYDRSLSDLTPFQDYIVASGREDGIPRVWIVALDEHDRVSNFTRLDFDEAAHDVGVSTHFEFDTNKVVVTYDSLVTPAQSLEISMSDPTQRTVLKQRVVPGYDPAEYGCDRVLVTSRDGSTEIPVSLVYRKDVMEEHQKSGQPVYTHLYGYGSYGSCCEADFGSTRLPLLNRGMVYVIAHVRGGGEMGRQWYEEPNGAKYLCKKNTFNDFVDVAKWLIDDKKLTTPDKLSCEGRSAGGLLIGASINQAPSLFKMALLGVPFVDVLCTMVDATIPLTAPEWEEWGNPNEQKFFNYMKEYSPVNNVMEGATYPSCLLTGGLHDPRVQYWEPTKFAAELRHKQGSDSGPVCIKMDMSAGHFSASDRYKYLKELAFDYAFLLDQLGLVK